MTKLKVLPFSDSPVIAEQRRRELCIRPEIAESLGRSALEAADQGYYLTDRGVVDWKEMVRSAVEARISIPPDASLESSTNIPHEETRVQIANETTLAAARRLVERGERPLALNFANGVETGGGFLRGATAQEETLCRSSALYLTLVGDPMYEYHRQGLWTEASSWAILSPDVPVFRTDDGMELPRPWLLSFITCAAPYAPDVGQPRSQDLLRQRIHRVLAIAQGYGYDTLVLGAWGCGAFQNDPVSTARDFREALETNFAGSFEEVVFAITDASGQRRSLQPFLDAFRVA